MATETAQPTPVSFPSRVLSIPLVSSSIETIQNTLTSSPYIQKAYTTSTSLAQSAYEQASKVAAPVSSSPYVQKAYTTSSSFAVSAYESASKVTAPVYTAADGYANKGLDTLKAKFPYPFELTTERLLADLKKAPENTRIVAYKTLDEKIKTPAIGIAKDVDTRLTPLVDLLEAALIKIHATPQPQPAESDDDDDDDSDEDSDEDSDDETPAADKAQVTRAKDLVVGAGGHLLVLTAEQAKALREQNIYIQRAAERAEAINAVLAVQYKNASAGFNTAKGKGVELGKEAQAKVYALSHSLVAELEKIQATTAKLPAQIQTTFTPLTDKIAPTLTDIKTILASTDERVGISEKASRVGALIKERVGPIVEEGRTIVVAAVDKFLPKKAPAAAPASTEGATSASS